MKRLLLGIAAAGVLTAGLAFAAGTDRGPATDGDQPRHECPMDDCPMHGPGKWHHGPMDGMGPMGGPGMMHGPARLLGRLGDELKLTDAQRSKIRELLDAARPEMDRLHDEMRSAGQELARIAPDDKTYDATVATTSRRIGELTTRMIQQASDLRARTHAVLTPEQKTQLAAIKAKMMERMKDMKDGCEHMKERGQHRHPAEPAGQKTPAPREAT